MIAVSMYGGRMSFERSLQLMYDRFYNFNWKNKQIYCNFLAQSYYYICHSARLLATAAGRCSLNEQELFKRMSKYVGEELSRENLCLRDLKVLGKSIKDFPELPITAAFYQSQYYKVEHNSPSELMGYIYALETTAYRVGSKVINDKLKEIYNPFSYSYLQSLTNEDVSYVEEAKRVISNLANDQKDSVLKNIIFTSELFIELLNQIEAKSNESLKYNSGTVQTLT